MLRTTHWLRSIGLAAFASSLAIGAPPAQPTASIPVAAACSATRCSLTITFHSTTARTASIRAGAVASSVKIGKGTTKRTIPLLRSSTARSVSVTIGGRKVASRTVATPGGVSTARNSTATSPDDPTLDPNLDVDPNFDPSLGPDPAAESS